jgi:probable HAF family extracellular repeat protein
MTWLPGGDGGGLRHQRFDQVVDGEARQQPTCFFTIAVTGYETSGHLHSRRRSRLSVARAVNSSGQVAGASRPNYSPAWHAFLHSAGVMTDLGTLGGAGSWANAMNDGGQVVGWADKATGARHAYLYANETMSDPAPWEARRAAPSQSTTLARWWDRPQRPTARAHLSTLTER